MYDIAIIKETFESQMNLKVKSIHKFENVPNNQVFKVETESQPYIFKIFSTGWPEDGKLPFVAHKLDEYNIPHAKLYVYIREDNNFPSGYLIEKCLPGITADRLTMSGDETKKLFEKLAVLVSQVHHIKLKNFGYTGSGVAMWTTFSEYIYDMFDESTSNLRTHHLIEAVKLETIRQELHKRLMVCDQFPSVLCHGDLSTKNIIVHSDDIVLIDWDDTQSLCWMADIARLTFWMKLNYDDENADTYRRAFLDCYETEYDKNIFYNIEDVLHVWYGLDYLNFSAGNPRYQYQYDNVKAILQNALKSCNMEMIS
ncbi:MAG: choline kinase [Herbinix sp.]|jgi:thiamine kinase-like enzyme|nr:choline kinase [Herbinix sp.]